MQSFSILALAVAILGPICSAAPVQAPNSTESEVHAIALATRGAGSVRYRGSWTDGAFRRYRFTFSGVSEGNFGQDFLNSIRAEGGITHNWQCYQDGNGVWTFDDSEAWGIAGATIIGDAVKRVTGQSCQDVGYAVGRSVENCHVINQSGCLCEI